jgi:hypothetical protein
MTTEEVIEFLQHMVRQGYTKCAGLAVAFEHETKFIFAKDECGLEHLNELVEAGGTPIGVVGIQRDPVTKEGNIGYALLPEWTEENEVAWATELLSRVCINFVAEGMISDIFTDFKLVGDH